MILKGIAASMPPYFSFITTISPLSFSICCFLPHYTWRYVCACIYVGNIYLHVYACSLSNPILLLLHVLAPFHILTPTKHRQYSLDYHGLDIKLTIDLCRKLFKGLLDPFLNSLHSFFGSLQVPSSLITWIVQNYITSVDLHNIFIHLPML